MKTRFFILVMTLFTIAEISAQENTDLFGISFMHNPGVGLADPFAPALEDLNMNVQELEAFVRIPVKLKNDKTVLVNELRYNLVRAPFDDLPNDRSFDANLHSLQYNLGVIQGLDEKWGIKVNLKPTLASNFNGGISSDDFFFQGSLVVFKKVDEFIKYGLGAAYTNGFGEPKTVPILAFNYKGDAVRLDVVAPTKLNFAYQPGKIAYGFDVELDGGQYHLSSQEGDGPIVTNQETVKFSRYNVGPTIGWNVNDNSRFEISAGISLKRTLKAIDTSGVETDYDMENGVFFKSAFIFGK
ncbi:MAG: DUF6268 family outer membrane beta-barrel protein [Allomuricauda sp.]